MPPKTKYAPHVLFVQTRRFPSRESYATWLFEFLRADIATMSADQERDWRRDARDFVDLGEGVIIDLTRGGGLPAGDRLPTVAFLKEMQQQLRTGLEALWRGEDDWVRPPISKRLARAGKLLTESRQGSFRNLFINAMQDIVVENWPRIHTCARCGQSFLKVRKQQYCSPACSQKTRSARFAAKHQRNYRREYQRAVQKKLGTTAPLKIGRHQRPGLR